MPPCVVQMLAPPVVTSTAWILAGRSSATTTGTLYARDLSRLLPGQIIFLDVGNNGIKVLHPYAKSKLLCPSLCKGKWINKLNQTMLKVPYVTGSKGETVSAGNCCDLAVKITQWPANFLSVSP